MIRIVLSTLQVIGVSVLVALMGSTPSMSAQGPLVLMPPVHLPTSGSGVVSDQVMAIADLNGDGYDDLVIGQYVANNYWQPPRLKIFLSTGATTVGAVPSFTTMEIPLEEQQDWDTEQVTRLANDPRLNNPKIGLRIGDVNQDGCPDIYVWSAVSGQMQIFWNQRCRKDGKWIAGMPIFAKDVDGTNGKWFKFPIPFSALTGGGQRGDFGVPIDCLLAELNRDTQSDFICYIASQNPLEGPPLGKKEWGYQSFSVILGLNRPTFPGWFPDYTDQLHPGRGSHPGDRANGYVMNQGPAVYNWPTTSEPPYRGVYTGKFFGSGMVAYSDWHLDTTPPFSAIEHSTGRLFHRVRDNTGQDLIYFEGSHGRIFQLAYDKTSKWVTVATPQDVSAAYVHSSAMALSKTALGQPVLLIKSGTQQKNLVTGEVIENLPAGLFNNSCELGANLSVGEFQAGRFLLATSQYRRVTECDSGSLRDQENARLVAGLKADGEPDALGLPALLLIQSLEETSGVKGQVFKPLLSEKGFDQVRAVPFMSSIYRGLQYGVMHLGASGESALVILQGSPSRGGYLDVYWESTGTATTTTPLVTGIGAQTDYEMFEALSASIVAQGEAGVVRSPRTLLERDPIRYLVVSQGGVRKRILPVAKSTVEGDSIYSFVPGLKDLSSGDYVLEAWNSQQKSLPYPFKVVKAFDPQATNLESRAKLACGIVSNTISGKVLFPESMSMYVDNLPSGKLEKARFQNVDDPTKYVDATGTDLIENVGDSVANVVVKFPATLADGTYRLYLKADGLWRVVGKFRSNGKATDRVWTVNRSESCQDQLPVLNEIHPGFCDSNTFYLAPAKDLLGNSIAAGNMAFIGSSFVRSELKYDPRGYYFGEAPLVKSAVMKQGGRTVATAAVQTLASSEAIEIDFGDVGSMGLVETEPVDLFFYDVPAADIAKGAPPIAQLPKWRTPKKGSCPNLVVPKIESIIATKNGKTIEDLEPGMGITMTGTNFVFPNPDTLYFAVKLGTYEYKVGPLLRSKDWTDPKMVKNKRLSNSDKVRVHFIVPQNMKPFKTSTGGKADVEPKLEISGVVTKAGGGSPMLGAPTMPIPPAVAGPGIIVGPGAVPTSIPRVSYDFPSSGPSGSPAPPINIAVGSNAPLGISPSVPRFAEIPGGGPSNLSMKLGAYLSKLTKDSPLLKKLKSLFGDEDVDSALSTDPTPTPSTLDESSIGPDVPRCWVVGFVEFPKVEHALYYDPADFLLMGKLSASGTTGKNFYLIEAPQNQVRELAKAVLTEKIKEDIGVHSKLKAMFLDEFTGISGPIARWQLENVPLDQYPQIVITSLREAHYDAFRSKALSCAGQWLALKTTSAARVANARDSFSIVRKWAAKSTTGKELKFDTDEQAFPFVFKTSMDRTSPGFEGAQYYFYWYSRLQRCCAGDALYDPDNVTSVREVSLLFVPVIDIWGTPIYRKARTKLGMTPDPV